MTKYRVTGPNEVLDHLPGQTFEADISDIQEERLVAGGHIERMIAEDVERVLAKRSPKAKAADEAEVPGASAGDTEDKE